MAVIRIEGTALLGGGIIRHFDRDLGRPVLVRVRQAADGRWEVDELYLGPAEKPVLTDDLRRVPLGQIEAFANRPDVSAELLAGIQGPERSLEAASTAEEAIPPLGARRQGSARARLRVPTTRNQYGDPFYEQVAAVYLSLVERRVPPAPEIARANDVPLSTARRWVKESRRRGFLPPGRAGKVG